MIKWDFSRFFVRGTFVDAAQNDCVVSEIKGNMDLQLGVVFNNYTGEVLTPMIIQPGLAGKLGALLIYYEINGILPSTEDDYEYLVQWLDALVASRKLKQLQSGGD